MPEGKKQYNKSLGELLEKRTTIEGKLREWNDEKADVERKIFKQLIKEERVEYFTINWRKLHTHKHRGVL